MGTLLRRVAPLAWLAMATPALGYEVLDKELDGRAFSRVRLNLGGFVQPRFRWVPEDTEANTIGDLGFSVQRARFELVGELLPPEDQLLGFSILQQLSLELTIVPRLEDAFVDLGFGTLVRLRAGQFKVPAHRAILVSDAHNLFPDRSQIINWVPERDIGASLHGYWGKRFIEYEVGVFNGEGKNQPANQNRKFLYAGRIVFSPWGAPGAQREILLDWQADGHAAYARPYVSVGYAVHQKVLRTSGNEEASIGHNVEGFLHWRFLTVQSEFFWRFIDAENVSVADYNQIGWYVQFGAFLYGVPWAQRHLALMGRIEQGDPFMPQQVDLPPASANDATQAQRNISVGLGLYAGEPLFRFVQDLRLVVTYTVRQELEGFAAANNELNVSANLTF